eukprot:g489.t1
MAWASLITENQRNPLLLLILLWPRADVDMCGGECTAEEKHAEEERKRSRDVEMLLKDSVSLHAKDPDPRLKARSKHLLEKLRQSTSKFELKEMKEIEDVFLLVPVQWLQTRQSAACVQRFVNKCKLEQKIGRELMKRPTAAADEGKVGDINSLYAVVSYCWSEYDVRSLCSAIWEEIKLRDLAGVVKYVWVDLFCVPQYDQALLIRHLSALPTIYANARYHFIMGNYSHTRLWCVMEIAISTATKYFCGNDPIYLNSFKPEGEKLPDGKTLAFDIFRDEDCEYIGAAILSKYETIDSCLVSVYDIIKNGLMQASISSAGLQVWTQGRPAPRYTSGGNPCGKTSPPGHRRTKPPLSAGLARAYKFARSLSEYFN